jgi:hypothetical protein
VQLTYPRRPSRLFALLARSADLAPIGEDARLIRIAHDTCQKATVISLAPERERESIPRRCRSAVFCSADAPTECAGKITLQSTSTGTLRLSPGTW